jgi:hypothetical protein
MPGEGGSGLSLILRAVDLLKDSGVYELVFSSVWPPFAVVLGGVLLLLLGMLLFRPARAHRPVGLVALLISIGVGAAVVVLFVGAGWRLDQIGLGMWFAVAVPTLGLLGALKAMLTAPRVTVEPVSPSFVSAFEGR